MEIGNLWLEKLATEYWALHPNVIPVIENVINNKLQGNSLKGMTSVDEKNDLVKYNILEDGTAIIKLHGVFLKKKMTMQGMSGLVSMLDAEATMIRALEDNRVKKIVLDIDSPGGSVSGVSEVSDVIYKGRDEKEIVAYANGSMCSAAYWIGSSASKVYSYSTSIVGSIGVYLIHSDYSKAIEDKGVKLTLIKAGEKKALGNPYFGLSEEDIESIQESVNFCYDLFVTAVARNRDIDFKYTKENLANGLSYMGTQALDIGLIDGIKNMTGILNPSSNYSFLKEGTDMDLKDVTIDQLKAENPALVSQIKQESEAKNEALIEENSALKAHVEQLSTKDKVTSYAIKLGLTNKLDEIINEGDSFETAVDKLITFKAEGSGESPEAKDEFYGTAPEPAGAGIEDEMGSEVKSKETAMTFCMKRDGLTKAEAWSKARREYPKFFDTRPQIDERN